jgi:hypothetical protein
MDDTAALFTLAIIWSLIALVLVRFIPRWPARIATFALLVGVPFWELPVGYYNLYRLCEKEAKLVVLEPIAPQKSICFDYAIESSVSSVLARGFERVESKVGDGGYAQYTREGGPPTLSSSRVKSAESEYCIAFSNNNRVPWRTIRHDFLIVRVKDKATMARHSVFDWLGMWWQEETSPILGRGGSCRSDQVQSILSALLVGSK